MSQNPNGPTPDQEQGRAFAIAIIMIAILIYVIAVMQEEISAFSGAVSYLHIYPFAMLVEYYPQLKEIPFLGDFFFARVEMTRLFLDQGNFAYMSPEQRRDVLTAAGICAMPIYLPFMIYAGTAGRMFRPDIKYKTPYTLDNMIWTQSEHWLTSRVARHVNPLKMPEVSAGVLARGVTEKTEGRKSKHRSCGHLISLAPEIYAPLPWHRALRPEEWLVATGLCLDQKQVDAARERSWSYPDGLLESRDMWHNLTLETLKEAFSAQLRYPWSGYEPLRPVHKAVAAVMCLFYDYDINGGNALLNDIGAINDGVRSKTGAMDKALTDEAGFMERIDKILTGKAGKQMLEVANRHAWVESAFPAMLTFARKDRGVLPAAAFLWLKSEDRRLWYILNNVGSEAVMVEAAGALGHFRAEMQIGKPIRRPHVYQAARAMLEDYLDMTPERIASRADKEERGRTAGQTIDLMLS
ncbi:hypothetical protein [Pseudosulfitobacter pseudonitzschiae]|uniref:secretion/conjugation apparatus DotM-related subunit n=1 Tax=Pseudosulfitobacter pseudonitzschiae TaxID=1402135 RepID=UPI003B7EB25D